MALVLAGGTGSRMGRPKQFIDLLGRPALHHTLRAFEDAPSISRIYTVGDGERIRQLVSESGIRKFGGCAEPGETRSLSTRSGLRLCGEDEEAIVLIHDGSRCLVTPRLIERVVEAAREEPDGVIPTVPVSDTIKVAENGSVKETLDRNRLHATQTPQAFRLGLLREIYAAPEERLRAATDDASLVESAGGRVGIVAGEKTNVKLTSPEDLVLAEAILLSRGEERR
ncbi:MAG: 2-C-methyl-D-erythritol 4-phosphate cytidylyltransferase [Rubrobacteraceae bacterium]